MTIIQTLARPWENPPNSEPNSGTSKDHNLITKPSNTKFPILYCAHYSFTIHYSVGIHGHSSTPDCLGMKFVDPISATAALLSPLCFQVSLEIVRNSYKLTVFQKAKSSNNNSVYYFYRNFYAGTPIVGHFQNQRPLLTSLNEPLPYTM